MSTTRFLAHDVCCCDESPTSDPSRYLWTILSPETLTSRVTCPSPGKEPLFLYLDYFRTQHFTRSRYLQELPLDPSLDMRDSGIYTLRDALSHPVRNDSHLYHINQAHLFKSQLSRALESRSVIIPHHFRGKVAEHSIVHPLLPSANSNDVEACYHFDRIKSLVGKFLDP